MEKGFNDREQKIEMKKKGKSERKPDEAERRLLKQRRKFKRNNQ